MRHSHSHGQPVINANLKSSQFQFQGRDSNNNQPKTFRMNSYNVGVNNNNNNNNNNRRSQRYSKHNNGHGQNYQQRKQEVLQQGKKLEKFMCEMHHIFHEHHFDNQQGVRRTILWQLFQQEKEKEQAKEKQGDEQEELDLSHDDATDIDNENGHIDAMDLTASQFRTLLQQANHLGLVNIEFRKIDPNDENCTKQVFIHLSENGLGVPQIVQQLQQSQRSRIHRSDQLQLQPTRAQTTRASNHHNHMYSKNNINLQRATSVSTTTPIIPTKSMFDYNVNGITGMDGGLTTALATQQMQLQMQYQGMQSPLQSQPVQQMNQFGGQLGQLPQLSHLQGVQGVQGVQGFRQSMQSPMHNMQDSMQQLHFPTTPIQRLSNASDSSHPQMQRRRSSEFVRKTIKCSFCGKMFYNERGLKQHSLQRHAKALGFEYTCKYCNYHFTNQIEYDQHVNEAHSNQIIINHNHTATGNVSSPVA